MNRFRYKLQHFMDGRNGMDDLGKVLWISALVFCVLSLIFKNTILNMISWFGLIYECYRIFSRNLTDRQEENKKYLGMIRLNRMRFEQRKEFRIYRCAGCGRIIRVPKGKGKVEVTCPVCGYKKIHRT